MYYIFYIIKSRIFLFIKGHWQFTGVKNRESQSQTGKIKMQSFMIRFHLTGEFWLQQSVSSSTIPAILKILKLRVGNIQNKLLVFAQKRFSCENLFEIIFAGYAPFIYGW